MIPFGGRYVPLPCVECIRGKRDHSGQWICSQEGFRPRPISEVKNCRSLNKYLNNKNIKIKNK